MEIVNIKNKKLQFNLKLQEILDNIFPILLKGCHSHPALPCNAQIANSNHRDAQEWSCLIIMRLKWSKDIPR